MWIDKWWISLDIIAQIENIQTNLQTKQGSAIGVTLNLGSHKFCRVKPLVHLYTNTSQHTQEKVHAIPTTCEKGGLSILNTEGLYTHVCILPCINIYLILCSSLRPLIFFCWAPLLYVLLSCHRRWGMHHQKGGRLWRGQVGKSKIKWVCFKIRYSRED